VAKISPDEICPCNKSGKLFKDCHGPKVRTQNPPEIRHRIPLKVISEPDPNTRSVIDRVGKGTIIIQGFHTEIGLTCGTCDAILIAGMDREQITSIVLRCNKCGAFNET
jgi:hypothetical protein